MKKHNIPNLGIGFIENGKIKETTVYGNTEPRGLEDPRKTLWTY